jgi:hypothetical protein
MADGDRTAHWLVGAFTAILGLIALDLWLAGDWTEAADQRVLTCTVTDKMEGSREWGIPPLRPLPECGELVIPADMFGAPQFSYGPVYQQIQVGHTYRLRVGAVVPPLGPAFVRILAVEGER